VIDVRAEEEQSENLKIKDSLVFSVRKNESEYLYIVEDTFSERYYRIGEREYHFIVQLDGTNTLGSALENTNKVYENDPLSEQQATEVITWLLKEQLLEKAGTLGNLIGTDPAGQTVIEKIIKKMNVIFFRLPLLNPDTFLDTLLPKVSWMVSKSFIFLWAFLLFSGIYHIISHWTRFEQASLGVFYPLNWLWLIIGYIIIKTSHEIFHGLVSKYYGGAVNEAGVIFVLFIPIGYVNATSSWHFPNKWQRFHTAVAGMFIELLFASVACWVWAYTDKGPVNNFAYNIIIIASVSTLLFNANPLMRFDGYFALSDALNIPNLYARGRQYIQYLLRKYIFGQKVVYPNLIGYQNYIIKAYGIASTVWRLFILIVILIAAYSLFYGAGIVLAGIALLGMMLPPSIRFFKKITTQDQAKQSFLPITIRVMVLVSVIGVVLTQLSWSRDVIAPGVIDYAPNGFVRSQTNGFLSRVHVRQGDIVKQGQTVAELDNRQLLTDLDILTNQLARAEAAARIYLNYDELAKYKIENDNIEASKMQLALKQEQVDSLVIRAPIDGTVVTDQLYKNLGQYIEIGESLFQVGSAKDKVIYISVLQKDQYDHKKLSNKPLEVRINHANKKTLYVQTQQETPRAYKALSYPQLAASNGGPLAVIPAAEGNTNSMKSTSRLEYLEPRGEIFASFEKIDAEYASAGQIALVRLPSIKQPLGMHLFYMIYNWVHYLFDRERW
jgi:putative peptide zinc metalloprotease protein